MVVSFKAWSESHFYIVGASLSKPHLVMSMAALSVCRYICTCMYGTYVRQVYKQCFVNCEYATSVVSMPVQCFGNYTYVGDKCTVQVVLCH